MKNKHLWVGYLTLADKNKTLVASDARVETGKPKTLFLYNQERDQIIEYGRDIIQSKLKDAAAADYDAAKITAAYKKALKSKLPNLYRVVFTPSTGTRATVNEDKPAAIIDDNDDDIVLDDNFVFEDGDTTEEDLEEDLDDDFEEDK